MAVGTVFECSRSWHSSMSKAWLNLGTLLKLLKLLCNTRQVFIVARMAMSLQGLFSSAMT